MKPSASALIAMTSIIGLVTAGAALAVQSGAAHGGRWCGAGMVMDCQGVLGDARGSVLGLPIAAAAAAYFLVRLGLLAGRRRIGAGWARAEHLLAVVAMLIAVAFLAIMAWSIGRFCWMCLTIDACLLVQAAVALRAWPSTPRQALGGTIPATGVLALAVLLLGVLLAFLADRVRIERDRAAAAGLLASGTMMVTAEGIPVTCFIDYACPACRSSLVALRAAEHASALPVRLAFVHVPLDSTCNPQVATTRHPGACDLALRAIAATGAGTLEEFQQHLLAGGATAADAAAPATDDQRRVLQDDLQRASAAHVTSLPTYLIGPYRIEGSHSVEFFSAVLAGIGARPSGTPGPDSVPVPP